MNFPRTFPEHLALLNACLNATSAILLVCGIAAIKAKRVVLHKGLMLGALGASILFLASYLTRIVIAGDTRFQGQGTSRTVYFVVLISHVVLAGVSLPLVLRTVYLAFSNRLQSHRRLAKITFPVWLYVSITGVVVYVMLYQWSALG